MGKFERKWGTEWLKFNMSQPKFSYKQNSQKNGNSFKKQKRKKDGQLLSK